MPEDDDFATELRGDPAPKGFNAAYERLDSPEYPQQYQPARERPTPHHKAIPVTDARFTVFVKWVCGIAATLITAGILSIANISVSTARKVDVLVEKTSTIEKQVEKIERRQMKEKEDER